MFEDSLVESRVGELSSSKRWTTVASIGLQLAVAGLCDRINLCLHPEALPFSIEAPKMLLPLFAEAAPAPPLRVVQQVTEATSSFAAAAPSQPAFVSTLLPGQRGWVRPKSLHFSLPAAWGMRDGLPIGIGVGEGGATS